MPSDLYWIEGLSPRRLAIMARPRAGDWLEDEVDHWQRSGVEIVVSLLEAEEVADLGLDMEAALCEQRGIGFRSFPIADRGLPDDPAAALQFAGQIKSLGKTTAVHCRAGIGRSSLMAATIMLQYDIEPADALIAIGKARGLPVPDTDAQRAWILSLANA